jgi:3-oxoadipate CoA-transferase, alpha subunit
MIKAADKPKKTMTNRKQHAKSGRHPEISLLAATTNRNSLIVSRSAPLPHRNLSRENRQISTRHSGRDFSRSTRHSVTSRNALNFCPCNKTVHSTRHLNRPPSTRHSERQTLIICNLICTIPRHIRRNLRRGQLVDKTLKTADEAVEPIFDGATLLLGGFGDPGLPGQLLEALRRKGTKDLTVVHNGAGAGDWALGGLSKDGRVKKVIASFPNNPGAVAFQELYLKGQIELELVPQGTLAERIRAAGAGLGGFYTPTGAGTEMAKGKETRTIDGRDYVFEKPLRGDFALIRAHLGDRIGNLAFRKAMRNFNVPMATAGNVTIAEVDELVPVGGIDPEQVHTPGIFVDHVVHLPRHPKLVEIGPPK